MSTLNLLLCPPSTVPHRERVSEADGDLWSYVARVRPTIEKSLVEHLPLAPLPSGTRFNDALRWSLFPGGKRLRPVLTLLGAEIVGGSIEQVLVAAAAVEYVHTSSLIFDDLPCMDDARERRGRTALHRQYDEALAVLVALALMNSSYGLVLLPAKNSNGNRDLAFSAHRELVEGIGANGMVVGQTIDLAGRDARNSADGASAKTNHKSDGEPDERNLKTSALIRMALRIGATFGGANTNQLRALTAFADFVGDAYQTSDDVIDLVEDEALTSDNRRATLALEQGVSVARRRVREQTEAAKDVLRSEFGDAPAACRLCAVADYVARRAVQG